MGQRRDLWTKKLAGKASVSGKLDAEALREKASAKSEADAAGRGGALREKFVGVVLGVDPSLRGSGFAVLDFQKGGAIRLLHERTLKLPKRLSEAECLGEIIRATEAILDGFPVAQIAIESTIYVQNLRSMQSLGAARGAVVAAAAARNLEVSEYPPLVIKRAVFGRGAASKPQVAAMVQRHLCLEAPLGFDASDAAAAALCHGWGRH